MQTTLEGAICREANKMLFEKNGKIYCHISNLRLWPKNPKVPNAKAQKILTNSIKKFGLVDPLKITPDGEILGGNQRFRVLEELSKKDKRFEWIWVEELDLWTDQERFEFALLDNFEAGEYVEQELKDIVDSLTKQGSLFSEMELKIDKGTRIDEIVHNLSIPKNELIFKNAKKSLKDLGINDETLQVLETMVTFNKVNEDLEDVDIQGCITGQRFPLVFWFEDETLYNQMKEVYNTGYKDKHNVAKLIELTENHLNVKFPTDLDVLVKSLEEIQKLEQSEKDVEELGGSEKTGKKISKELEEKRMLATKLYKTIFKPKNGAPEGGMF